MNVTNLTLKVLGLFLALMPFHAAFANGGSDGGGGGAMTCYFPNGHVKSAEILDLWEARNLKLLWEKPDSPYKLHVPYSSEPVATQIARAMVKLRQIDPLFADRVQKDLDFVQQKQNQHPMEKGISIEPPSDAQNVYYETGCKLDGMLWFDKNINKLSIKEEIFSKSINNTVIAASYTHEAIYKTLRDLRRVAGDSEPVRRINACLYATDDCFGLADLIPVTKSTRVFHCTSAGGTATVTAEPMAEDPAAGADKLPYDVKLQLDQLGATPYPVPATAEAVMYFNRDGSDTDLFGYETTVSNRAFEFYLRTQGSDEALFESRPTTIVSEPMRSAYEFSGRYSHGSLTLSLPMLKVIYNGLVIPQQVFECK